MYSNESLKKLYTLFHAATGKYYGMNPDDIRLCISGGNRKIGRVMNVSLPPVLTCSNCSECRHYCYDIKACLQYPNTVVDARIRNYVVLALNRDLYFSRIDAAMNRRRKNKFFRWHVSGDIVDIDYFNRMIENARRHPDFIIWTYTKNYHVVNDWIAKNGVDALPVNFTIMFSQWRGIPMINPYGMPEFRVVMHDDSVKPTGYYCPGNCDICKSSRRGCINHETVYCNEH